MQVVRQKEVVVRDFSVASEGLHGGGLLGVGQTHHVHWGVVLQLGLVVVLLVVLLALHLSHLHVVNQQRIVLDAAVANMVALCLFISQFVLVLHERKTFSMNNILNLVKFEWYYYLQYSQLTLLAISLELFAARMGIASSFT